MRDTQKVINEILTLNKNFNTTNFEFYDLTAIINKKWILDFCHKLIELQKDFTWKIPAGTRSEVIDFEVADNLKKSGCYSITYAPESGSKRMLEIIKKKVDLDRMLDSIIASKKAGMHIMINMIIALPEEKTIDILKTMWFLVKCSYCGVDDLNLAVFRPYPGSSLFNELEKKGVINMSSDDFLIESLENIDTPLKGIFFNKNISRFAYKIYYFLNWILFYSVKFIMNPKKFISFLKNIYNGTSHSMVEQLTLFHLDRIKKRIGV